MQDVSEPPVKYESYLLRLRRTTQDGQPVCQVELVDLSSQETLYFADLAKLAVYLAQGGEPPADWPPSADL